MKHNKRTRQYARVHYWLRKNYGSPNICESKDCLGESKVFEWALKTGKKHSKNIDNYLRLCHKCHTKYDWNDDKTKRLLMISHTEEANKKRAESKIGVPRPEWVKKILSEKNMGKKMSAEAIINMRNSHIGKKLPKEQVEKMRVSQIERWKKIKSKTQI